MTRPGEVVGCPECATELYVIRQGKGEFELECVKGHLIRLFFQLTMPDPPPRKASTDAAEEADPGS